VTGSTACTLSLIDICICSVITLFCDVFGLTVSGFSSCCCCCCCCCGGGGGLCLLAFCFRHSPQQQLQPAALSHRLLPWPPTAAARPPPPAQPDQSSLLRCLLLLLLLLLGRLLQPPCLYLPQVLLLCSACVVPETELLSLSASAPSKVPAVFRSVCTESIVGSSRISNRYSPASQSRCDRRCSRILVLAWRVAEMYKDWHQECWVQGQSMTCCAFPPAPKTVRMLSAGKSSAKAGTKCVRSTPSLTNPRQLTS